MAIGIIQIIESVVKDALDPHSGIFRAFILQVVEVRPIIG